MKRKRNDRQFSPLKILAIVLAGGTAAFVICGVIVAAFFMFRMMEEPGTNQTVVSYPERRTEQTRSTFTQVPVYPTPTTQPRPVLKITIYLGNKIYGGLSVAAQSNFEMEKHLLEATVFYQGTSEGYCNTLPIFPNEDPLDLSCGISEAVPDQVTGVRVDYGNVIFGRLISFSCNKVSMSVWECNER